MFDELKLLRGRDGDFAINDKIQIHIPTLDDICDYGEQDYYSMISTFTSTSSDNKSVLFDKLGLIWEDVSDFEFFQMSYKTLSQDRTRILCDGVDFSEFDRVRNTENGDIVLYNYNIDCVIDEAAYIKMSNFIRLIHGFKRNVIKAGNETTRNFLIEKERNEIIRNKRKKFKSLLAPLVSALVNCEQFKYSRKDVWDENIYAFMNSVQRIQKYKHYSEVMQGVYTGNIELTKINQEELDWMGAL